MASSSGGEQEKSFEEEFLLLLPTKFETKLVEFSTEKTDATEFSAKVAINLQSDENVKDFISEFGSETHTEWIIREKQFSQKKSLGDSTKQLRFVKYVCHLSKTNKSKLPKKPSTSRNFACEASISFNFHNQKFDPGSRRPYSGPKCVVTFNWHHSHSLESAATLGLLRVSEETKAQFYKHFDDGLNIPGAIIRQL